MYAARDHGRTAAGQEHLPLLRRKAKLIRNPADQIAHPPHPVCRVLQHRDKKLFVAWDVACHTMHIAFTPGDEKPTLYRSTRMILHSFWRSLATYRVRIALNLKGLTVQDHLIDLDRGDQHDPAYRAINPMGAVPALVLDDGTVLTQSLAILEWIEETHPAPPLLPQDPVARARIRALCAITAADTHPLVVPRVQKALAAHGLTEPQRIAWNADWFTLGLQAYEVQVGPGRFCAGTAPTLADACLASHVAGAERFGVDLAPFQAVRAIQAACMALPAFATAHPLRQTGAPK